MSDFATEVRALRDAYMANIKSDDARFKTLTDQFAADDLRAARIVPEGWYQDPSKSGELRWWNGLKWTDHLRPKPALLMNEVSVDLSDEELGEPSRDPARAIPNTPTGSRWTISVQGANSMQPRLRSDPL